MKFSQALRRADEIELPNIRGLFVESLVNEWKGEKPPCCAIGGANCAAGLTVIEVDGFSLTENSLLTFSRIDYDKTTFEGQCPACEIHDQVYLSDAVIHLYDTHYWSRTQIGEWIEQAGLDFEMPHD